MNKIRTFALITAFCAAFVLCFAPFADAKRFGGSRSFGSKPSMQRSFTPSKQQTTNSTTSTSSAQQQSTANAASQTPAKSSMFGGMGGMFGGLLAGSLLGSLLFGGSMGGGGMFDILLLALIGYGIYRFIASRRNAGQQNAMGRSQQPAGAGSPYGQQAGQNTYSYDNASTGWDNLRSTPSSGPVSEPAGPSIPANFDSEEFLRGAKMAFTRLQQSWDRRDMDDIALFATPHVLEEIRNQAEADPTPSSTEILLVNANILSVSTEDKQEIATVFFDVLLREDPKQEAPTNVREVWHFTRPADEHSSAMWLLDGIQQVEQ